MAEVDEKDGWPITLRSPEEIARYARNRKQHEEDHPTLYAWPKILNVMAPGPAPNMLFVSAAAENGPGESPIVGPDGAKVYTSSVNDFDLVLHSYVRLDRLPKELQDAVRAVLNPPPPPVETKCPNCGAAPQDAEGRLIITRTRDGAAYFCHACNTRFQGTP